MMISDTHDMDFQIIDKKVDVLLFTGDKIADAKDNPIEQAQRTIHRFCEPFNRL